MLVLTGILFLLLFVNVYQRLQPPQYEEWQVDLLSVSPSQEAPSIQTTKQIKSFASFDPNSADSSQLVAGGLSTKQASALIRYRNSGAKFKRKSDLLKLYWMTEELYARLQIEIQSPVERSNELPVKTPAAGEHILHYNLNEVDSITLVSIKGIGGYTANKVIRYREWLGGFTDTSQIGAIKGLRTEQIALLLQYHQGTLQPFRRLNLNKATLEEFKSHPFIRYKAKIIIAYRKQHGPFKELNELMHTKVFSETEMQQLLPYLEL